MSPITFDKLAYVDRLKAAGFNEPQARAMADSLDTALREEVATKADLAPIKTSVAVLNWMMGANIGLTLLVLGKLVLAK